VLHKGLPTTTIEQALLDYAATAPIERVRYALANADYHKVLDVSALQVIAGSGRRGSTKLRNALGVVPEEVVHPGLLGGWWLSKTPVPRRTPDEASR
jgi:hypothetical protein